MAGFEKGKKYDVVDAEQGDCVGCCFNKDGCTLDISIPCRKEFIYKEIKENDLLYDEDSGIVSAIKWKRHVCGYVYEKAGMFSTMRVCASHTSLLKIIGNKFDRKEGKE